MQRSVNCAALFGDLSSRGGLRPTRLGHARRSDRKLAMEPSRTDDGSMSRPFGCLNLTAEERAAIRAMFRDGVLVKEILRRSRRSETTVWRVVKGLRRRRPTSPPGRYAKRNDKILALVERGWSRARICEHFGLGRSQLGVVIAEHPRIRNLPRQGVRPAEIARRFRMETSTVLRVMGKKVERTRTRWWVD